MADRSKIEWTESSWNPVRARHRETGRLGWHCTHASEGCRNCYAEAMNRWRGTGLDYKPGHARDIEVFLDEKILIQPLRWKRARMIFVCSMTDLFADFVTDEMIDRVFAVMAQCRHHTFQVLTKRPERARAYVADAFDRVVLKRIGLANAGWPSVRAICEASGIPWSLPRSGDDWWPLRNVWLGTSVEDQATADARIPELLATPAAVRWVSAEPLLGPVDLSRFVPRERFYMMKCEHCGWIGSTEHAREARNWDDADVVCGGCGKITLADEASGLDWVVAGGESGAKARPMHPDWARSLRDQCAAAGVAFFFKQWGEWGPDTGPQLVDGEVIVEDRIMEGRARCAWWTGAGWTYEQDGYAVDLAAAEGSGEWLYRLGKKHNGRLLDGVTHDGYPEVRP
jgi:protein gp37